MALRDHRKPNIVLINTTAFVSEVILNWNHLELRTNLMDQRASVAWSGSAAVCWFHIPAVLDEDETSACNVKLNSVWTWVQEGRQDVGIAVEMNALLCHQIAISLSPLQQEQVLHGSKNCTWNLPPSLQSCASLQHIWLNIYLKFGHVESCAGDRNVTNWQGKVIRKSTVCL